MNSAACEALVAFNLSSFCRFHFGFSLDDLHLRYQQFLEDHKDNILRLLISQARQLSADRDGDFFSTADSEEMLEALQFILEAAEVR